MLTVFWDMKGPVTIDFLEKVQLYTIKKVMLTVFCEMKGPVTIDFLEKGTPVVNKEGHADGPLEYERTHHY